MTYFLSNPLSKAQIQWFCAAYCTCKSVPTIFCFKYWYFVFAIAWRCCFTIHRWSKFEVSFQKTHIYLWLSTHIPNIKANKMTGYWKSMVYPLTSLVGFMQAVQMHLSEVILGNWWYWLIATLFRAKIYIVEYTFTSSNFRFKSKFFDPLLWRHNERDSVSNHQRLYCLLKRLFRRRSKITSKLRVTGLCAWNSPGTGEFPAQKASNAENVFIWWRHHAALHG